ncbi:FtsW/RodA/SpoVE family cell cycle protein [Candidatus Beckwithbacteria bacterium]|nr:FtsW/RodA/SpoVE family cell cycle protein [Candidatus Beckwithbacteria bacterium]
MLKLPDLAIFIPAFLISVLGMIVIFSISVRDFNGQLMAFIIGIFFFILITQIDIHIFKALSPLAFIFTIIVLLGTLIFAKAVRGSARWIEIGSLHLQTSEFLKPVLILFLAYLSQILTLKNFYHFLLSLGLLLIPSCLVFIQPDLGSTIVILVLGLFMILLMAPKKRFVLAVLLLFLVALPVLWQNLAVYQKTRVLTFLEPEKDPLGSSYNQIQATIAAGSGQFFGKGLGKGTQSHLQFLPEKHTDFFFASLAEELGFVGSFVVLLLFLILNLRFLSLASKTKDLALKGIFIGAFALFLFQPAVHIGINLGVLPVTGITLPFMSVGGSSMLSCWIILGFVSSASKEIKDERSILLG